VDECVELVDGVRHGLVPALRVAHRQDHLQQRSSSSLATVSSNIWASLRVQQMIKGARNQAPRIIICTRQCLTLSKRWDSRKKDVASKLRNWNFGWKVAEITCQDLASNRKICCI
jgi:hypothetical protein